MHIQGHKQRYSNRPSVSDISEQKRLEKERKVSDIKNLTLRGDMGSMQEFISQAKNPSVNKKGYDINLSTALDKYRRENLWKQWRESGSPSVRTWSQEEFKKSGNVFKSGGGRAFYSPDKNRLTIRKGSVGDFFAELAHSAQWGGKDRSRRISLWDKFKYPYMRGKHGEDVYNIAGSMEYKAHSVIEPELLDSYYDSSNTIHPYNILNQSRVGLYPNRNRKNIELERFMERNRKNSGNYVKFGFEKLDNLNATK